MKIKLIGAALVAAATFAGCSKPDTVAEPAAGVAEEPAKDPNEVVLSVNGNELTRGKIDADVATIVAAQGDKIPAEQLTYAKRMFANQIAQGFLYNTILVAKATELGYEITDDDVKERETEFLKATAGQPDAPKSIEEAAEKSPLGKERTLAEFRNGILIDKMIKGEAISKNAKDYTAEAQKIVDDIKAENEKAAGGDEEALKKINELKAILDGVAEEEKAGKFAELAKEHSACPSSSKGGDLGEFTHGQMVKEFDEVAFSLPVGQISDPVKTQFGYHLVMTTGKTEATEATDDKPAAPEKVRASHILVKVPQTREVPDIDTVVAGLKRNDERKIVNDYVMSLVRAAKIEAADDFKQLLPPPEEPETVPVDSAE